MISGCGFRAGIAAAKLFSEKFCEVIQIEKNRRAKYNVTNQNADARFDRSFGLLLKIEGGFTHGKPEA